ncbi:hypothetical protein MKX01_026876 [Papaver californicum]|nr:hypothetical protein MKX01_026876 [Papaver californicum]
MSNKVDHEGAAQPIQPSSPTSQDSNQHRRQREEPDSNQSNQRRRIDDQTSSTEDNNNNSFSMSQENLERLRQQAYLQMDRQMEEDAIHDSDDDDYDTEEESSGWNSNSQDDQNQQGTPLLTRVIVLFNEGGVETTRRYDTLTLLSLNTENVGSLNIDVMMDHEELLELQERIGKVEVGLSKELISSHMKTRIHTTSADSSTEEETEICTICQDEYENKDKIATLDCQHEYHEDCITQWLGQKNVCPICKRQALKTMEEEC